MVLTSHGTNRLIDIVWNCSKLVVLMANEGEYCYDPTLKIHKGLKFQDII